FKFPDGSCSMDLMTHHGKALVVECESIVRNLLRNLLERKGYTVLLACAADEAFEMYRKRGPFDLLVVEMNLPGMNGIEFADRLSALQPTIRILFISGFFENSITEQRALGHGRAFLPKPFLGTTFDEKVRHLMSADSLVNN